MQETRVRFDVSRFVDDLRRRVELGVDARHLLHDLRGAHERALLAVQELRELPRLDVPANVRALLAGEPVPHVGAEDRDRFVGELLRVLGVEILRPVDPDLGVPLLLLALRVQADQPLAEVVVLPVEDGLEGPVDRPAGLLDRKRVDPLRGHRANTTPVSSRDGSVMPRLPRPR